MCEASWRTVASSGRSRLMRHHPFLIHPAAEKRRSRKPICSSADPYALGPELRALLGLTSIGHFHKML
jgi:hypothetical protein